MHILHILYIISFWVGLLVTAFTSLTGIGGRGGGHTAGHGFHVHLGAHGGHSSVQGTGNASGAAITQGPSPFNVSTIMTFLTVFGGVGFLMTQLGWLGGILTLLVAVIAGLLVAGLLFLMLVKVLLPGERVMEEKEYDLTGHIGQISVSIPSGGVGEIKYVLAETTRSMGARGIDGEWYDKGERVVIRAVAKGIALVESYESFMQSSLDP